MVGGFSSRGPAMLQRTDDDDDNEEVLSIIFTFYLNIGLYLPLSFLCDQLQQVTQ